MHNTARQDETTIRYAMALCDGTEVVNRDLRTES
jgi:hypothetical protein